MIEQRKSNQYIWRLGRAGMLAAAMMAMSGSLAQAAEEYVPGATYLGGDVTCLEGDLYEAKWWAGPGDRPSDVDRVAQPWETPWERINPWAPECSDNPVPEVATPILEETPPLSPENPVSPTTAEGPDATEETTPPPDSAGPASDSGCPRWNPDTIYLGGALVSHEGSAWEANWWTRGEVPGTTGPWGVWRTPATVTGDCSGENGSEPLPATQNEPEAVPTTTPSPASDDQPASTNTILLSNLLETEHALTNDPLMAEVRRSIDTLDNASVESVVPRRAQNPENVQRVESIVDAAGWDYLFPRRSPEYTYTNFLRAIAKFPAFCGTYEDGRDSDAICRKALATMFAHFTQETGGHTPAWPEPEWRQGLVYVRELGWSEEAPGGYGLCDPATWQGEAWPCDVFEPGHPSAGQYKSYFGRGAKQLSYNYNYGPFSEAMFGDVNVLLEEPNLVADTWLNLASAVFFYVYPQPPKPSMLHALDGTWVPNNHDLAGGLQPGFGVTTQIINGGIECGGTAEHRQSENRIDYYRNFARELGVPVPAEEVLGCANMQRFDTSGAGAMSINWEQAWSQPNACQLVSYQTPFSAFLDGDYARCVESFFDVTIIDDLE